MIRQRRRIASAAIQRTFNTLTDFVIFGGSIFYLMAVAAVFVLRAHVPNCQGRIAIGAILWCPLFI